MAGDEESQKLGSTVCAVEHAFDTSCDCSVGRAVVSRQREIAACDAGSESRLSPLLIH